MLQWLKRKLCTNTMVWIMQQSHMPDRQPNINGQSVANARQRSGWCAIKKVTSNKSWIISRSRKALKSIITLLQLQTPNACGHQCSFISYASQHLWMVADIHVWHRQLCVAIDQHHHHYQTFRDEDSTLVAIVCQLLSYVARTSLGGRRKRVWCEREGGMHS